MNNHKAGFDELASLKQFDEWDNLPNAHFKTSEIPISDVWLVAQRKQFEQSEKLHQQQREAAEKLIERLEEELKFLESAKSNATVFKSRLKVIPKALRLVQAWKDSK